MERSEWLAIRDRWRNDLGASTTEIERTKILLLVAILEELWKLRKHQD